MHIFGDVYGVLHTYHIYICIYTAYVYIYITCMYVYIYIYIRYILDLCLSCNHGMSQKKNHTAGTNPAIKLICLS